MTRLLGQHLRGLGAYYAGDFAAAAPLLRAALELAERADADASTESAEVLIVAAAVGLLIGDDRVVADLHRRIVARARHGGALGILSWALPRLAVSDIWAGRWTAASAGLTEALELARAMDQQVLVAYLLSELAIVAALRGREEECRSLAAESLELAARRGLAYVGYIANSALVTLELGLGRPEDALERSQAFAAMPGLDFWDALDRIESAVRAGEPAVARASLEPFAAWAEHSGSAWARPVALHCRALLTDDPGDAEQLFRAALDLHAQASRPFERARTELAFGGFLRRGPAAQGGPRPPARRARRGSRRSAPAHGPSAHAWSCARAGRPRAAATPARSTSSRPRSCRSSTASPRAIPTATSPRSCSSAPARSTSTCATSSASSASARASSWSISRPTAQR